MSSQCGEWAEPGSRAIAAGLTTIPRQPGDFADYRRSLLHAASAQPALALWRSRAPLELGLLLLEVWAYVLDVTGFYDETIAHEWYVRTARQQRSLHRLVELIGYVPRPAVAASVALAALARGPDGVLVPVGTGFRSAGLRRRSSNSTARRGSSRGPTAGRCCRSDPRRWPQRQARSC